MTTDQDRQRLRQLISGFQATQSIYVAAAIGLADRMAEGPRDAAELSILTGSHPQSLYRLMLALVALGILQCHGRDRFALTSMGQLLRRDVAGSQAHRAELMGRPYFWQAWGELSHAVRSGRTAFEYVHGVDGWTWRDAHPDDGVLFDKAMAADAKWMGRAIIEAYDFSCFQHIVDVGGGDGSLLAAILSRNPLMRGTVLEQQRLVDEAARSAARTGLGERCRFVAGNFFDQLPADGDAYVLKWILHNWSDSDSARILRNCRKVMDAGARLLIIEHVVDPETPDVAGTLMDINMLVMNGGRERTLAEFETLLRSADLEPVQLIRSSAGLGILEARAA